MAVLQIIAKSTAMSLFYAVFCVAGFHLFWSSVLLVLVLAWCWREASVKSNVNVSLRTLKSTRWCNETV